MTTTPASIRLRNRLYSESARRTESERAQARFDATVRTLATQLSDGTISAREWQIAMHDAVAQHMLYQALVGSRDARLSSERIQAIQAEFDRQVGFLSRFADTITTGKATGVPLSGDAIAARSASYGRAGIAEFWRSEVANIGDGYVIVYQARDDGVTCSACLAAERGGPYLPDDPSMPVPGSVCFGGARCRCRLVKRFDPATARRLAA